MAAAVAIMFWVFRSGREWLSFGWGATSRLLLVGHSHLPPLRSVPFGVRSSAGAGGASSPAPFSGELSSGRCRVVVWRSCFAEGEYEFDARV